MSSSLSAPPLPDFFSASAPVMDALACLRHGEMGDIPLPLLAGPEYDCWRSSLGVSYGASQGVQWADDGETLLLSLKVSEEEWTSNPAAATESAYRRLQDVRQARGVDHWWRLWNYLGDILAGDGDNERYRQFTLGRHRAWAATGQLATPLPAATAIGCDRGLHLFALAGRRPAQAIENPRQVNAWRYPRVYGIQPPSFARAALVQAGGGGLLFVSGTASIVGHESRHPGDVLAQLAEARANLDAVLVSAASTAKVEKAAFKPLNFKLYWSCAQDAAQYLAAADALLTLAPTQVLHGTICRRELVVEIEALYALTP